MGKRPVTLTLAVPVSTETLRLEEERKAKELAEKQRLIDEENGPDCQVSIRAYLNGEKINGREFPETYYLILRNGSPLLSGKFDVDGLAAAKVPRGSYAIQLVVERYKKLVANEKKEVNLDKSKANILFELHTK